MASNKELGAKSEKRVTFKDDKLNTQVSVPSRIPVRSNSVSRHSCSSRTGAIKKSPKKSQAKKSLVRNVEQPVSVSRHKGLSQCVDVHSLYSTRSSKTSDLGEPPHKYAVPELYTTLCLANEIRKTAQTVPKASIKSTKDLPPVKCQVAEETIAKKLNFPVEEHLYRDLIALNVREEDIVPAIGDRPSSRVGEAPEKMLFCPCGLQLISARHTANCIKMISLFAAIVFSESDVYAYHMCQRLCI
ncbi:uncharacterized protein LOC124777403 isoform X2 [Schistocerca piceifrons]|uniref:uncharacterized protein LOC124777403 isoform X2 n=1 Tax=Schistocerca piceifrons TaxID=274613 RepID=UPI001F5ECAF2|nr:uncharacterized protein LOC124777403 isoform X2 [Schistocerca piceifrons]